MQLVGPQARNRSERKHAIDRTASTQSIGPQACYREERAHAFRVLDIFACILLFF